MINVTYDELLEIENKEYNYDEDYEILDEIDFSDDSKITIYEPMYLIGDIKICEGVVYTEENDEIVDARDCALIYDKDEDDLNNYLYLEQGIMSTALHNFNRMVENK